ncbi:MAG TPA: 4-hydroxyproline epimerase [Candidatus Sulfotelmatobacter sp.]|jgi:4-hydroxyproline epimerase|nr:4-hydroxyproline epimerase [Candidatus Sulfotelmatobacter sp.]
MKSRESHRVRVIDSHTGGEPTRLVVSGGPDLGTGPLSDRLECFRRNYDSFRSAVVNEPRGSDVMVGALLCDPLDSACVAGVIFFNNVGYLGMCGHGTIGLVATLAYMNRIKPGEHQIETPVGTVTAVLHEGGEVTVNNVASYRSAANVAVDVPGFGQVHGDVAWGGNWFFLVREHTMELTLQNVDELTAISWAIRKALRDAGIAGSDGKEIDHVELFGPSQLPGVDSKNFVLCPGKAYDRSPCGTGTSAKLACLYADGKIREGQTWKQESIVGSVFEGSVKVRDGKVYPSIKGSAFVNAESELVLDPRDPLCMGIRA